MKTLLQKKQSRGTYPNTDAKIIFSLFRGTVFSR